MMRDALARLERAFVHDGGLRLREAVLEGRPGDGTWPADLPALPADARALLTWRAALDHPLYIELAGDTLQMLVLDSAAELTRELQAELPGSIALFGYPHLVCDAAGVVSRIAWDAEDRRIAIRTDASIPALVDRIAAGYAARRHSPLRRLRVTHDPDAAWTSRVNLASLDDAPVGTAIAWSVWKRWHRAWVAVRRDDRWVASTITWQDKDFDAESACEDLRRALGCADATVHTTAELVARIEEVPSGFRKSRRRRGSVHVWQQPPMTELLARLDALRDEIPLELAPGATPAELAELGEVPDDLRALYAHANGSTSAIYFRYRLDSIASARQTSAGLARLAAEQFGAAYWDRGFVPFLDKGNADNIYVDTAGVHGPPGCLIDFDHERPERREVLFDSVAQWLEHLVEGLEDGVFEWEDEAVFPRFFLEDGDLGIVTWRMFKWIYTNHAYPWTRTLALNDQ